MTMMMIMVAVIMYTFYDINKAVCGFISVTPGVNNQWTAFRLSDTQRTETFIPYFETLPGIREKEFLNRTI